jgi:hypothetical protein
MKYYFLILITTFKIFAANECTNDKAYNDAGCMKVDIVPSYTECAVKVFDDLTPACRKKVQDMMTCSIAILNSCGIPENDEGNKFELCLAQSSDSACKALGEKYK